MCEMAATIVLHNRRQHHQSIHLEVIGEKEAGTLIEFDGDYPRSELVTETTHTEVCGIQLLNISYLMFNIVTKMNVLSCRMMYPL